MTEDKDLRNICETIEHLIHENQYLFGLIEGIEGTGSLSQKRFNQSSVQQNDSNLMTELVSKLRQDVMSLNTVLEVKIGEFVAINDKNISLLLKVIHILRSFYGECHPRLALKLYLLAIIADKYPSLKRQLLTEAKTIAFIITPELNSNDNRSEPINRYSDQNIISDSLIDSTLLYEIQSQLME